jgi:hypothetical protein
MTYNIISAKFFTLKVIIHQRSNGCKKHLRAELQDLIKESTELNKNVRKNVVPPYIPFPANFSPDDIFPQVTPSSPPTDCPPDDVIFPKPKL